MASWFVELVYKHSLKITIDSTRFIRFFIVSLLNITPIDIMYDEEENLLEQYHRHLVATSTEKECLGCGEFVLMRPSDGYCDCCADRRESGWDF